MIEVHAKLFLAEPDTGTNNPLIRMVVCSAMVEQPDIQVMLRQQPTEGEPAAYELLERFIRQAFDAKEHERRDLESAYL